MEDPVLYNPPPSSTPNDIGFPLDGDDDLLMDALPENFSGDDIPFDVDFDFTFDDLNFADNLLLEPEPEPEPPGSDHGSQLSQDRSPCSDFENNRSPNPNFDTNGSPNFVVRVDDCSSAEANHGTISSEDSNFGVKSSCPSPESGNGSDRDVSSSFVDNNLSETSDLDRKMIKVEEIGISNDDNNKCVVSKRKKEPELHEGFDEVRTSKFRKSSETTMESVKFDVGNEEDDKRKARLMRNRESAQLSRQRKKQYVEELEDKMRSMHSTITELNSKIAYIMAENATLRQQLSGGGAGGGVYPALPPPPGMYPMAPMPCPWVPYPPYMVKPQGSHVPLVPIPRLKPQQPAPAPKVNKKLESKKSKEKTKKVASISFLGLLFFALLFGMLVPMVNVRYGGVVGGFSGLQKGTVLMVDKHEKKTSYGVGMSDGKFTNHGRLIQESNTQEGSVPMGNSSGPLVASLYVPRNDKLVKIDGNLIIHSVLASEKAMASHTDGEVNTSEETSLAIAGNYPPYPVPGPGRSNGRQSHLNRNPTGRQRALGCGSENLKPAGTDGTVQEWFREGLAGPMLSSGMCTEVFQFDVSPAPGAIVPATSMAKSKTTSKHCQNSTRLNKQRNRRILHGHPIPLDLQALNATEEHVGPHEQNNRFPSNKSRSSMVVSVLVDPREAGDGDGEGVIKSKTLSRIFVVVLIDSVKYVTYSCMLPFMGSGSHFMTT